MNQRWQRKLEVVWRHRAKVHTLMSWKRNYEDPGKLLKYYMLSTSLYGGGVWLLLDMPEVLIGRIESRLLSSQPTSSTRWTPRAQPSVGSYLMTILSQPPAFLPAAKGQYADIPFGTAHRLLDAIIHLQWGTRDFWRWREPDYL